VTFTVNVLIVALMVAALMQRRRTNGAELSADL